MTTTVPLTEILAKVKLPLHQRDSYAHMICIPSGQGLCSTGLDYVAYLVHAANQFTKLLATLERVACEPVGEENGKEMRELARQAIEEAQHVNYVHTCRTNQNY